MKIIPAIIGSVSTLAVCAGAGVGIGMATNEKFKNDVYTTIGVVSEQKYEETQTQLQEELEKITELQSDKAELENEIATIKNEKDDIASSLLTKESELETLTNSYNELVESNNATTAQLDTLASEIETKKTEIANLQAQYDECSAHLSGAYADISALNNQIASLQSQVENLQNIQVQLDSAIITFDKRVINLNYNTLVGIDNVGLFSSNGYELKARLNNLSLEPTSISISLFDRYFVSMSYCSSDLLMFAGSLNSDEFTVASLEVVDANNTVINIDEIVDSLGYDCSYEIVYTINEETGSLATVNIKAVIVAL